jgi:predicted component of type VI protein secretion system
MERTTVGSANNNPFKWAPAQRVAVDLLRGRDDGFLSGAEAVQASFEDMKKHVLCLLAGLRAVLASTLGALSPQTIEARLPNKSYLLKSRDAAAWEEYAKVHEALGLDAAESPDSAVNRAFREAYDRRLQQLDVMGTRE